MVLPVNLDSFTGYVDSGEKTSAELHREAICRNPRRKAALERARQQVAAALPKDTKFPLTRLRLRAGLSQADLAKLLNTHQPAIARLENGLSDPRLTTIKKLATALGVSEADILEAIDVGRTVGKAS